MSHVKGLILLAVLALFLLVVLNRDDVPRSELSYSFFLDQVEAKRVESVEISDSEILGRFKEKQIPDPPKDVANARPLQRDFRVWLTSKMDDPTLQPKLREHGVQVEGSEPTDSTTLLVIWWFFSFGLPMVALGVIVFIFLRRARDSFGGAGFLGNFNRSPARRYEPDKQRITFADVAGLEHVKKELQELVEFLKNPIKFQRLGARIPKGTLLMGAPGTGKTLLAKAVAGEAGVPFFSINGSEFIQMFVGVGASRVRDLFRVAKEASPCIVFIDEIDAVGRVRGAGFGGGHDEREQTLNQILSEMDGFSPNEAVIVVAATNRPDVLDPALLRPGRFDRHITVDRPTRKGRIELFQVHTRNVPLADDVDLARLATVTVGLTGADIRNLVNEAALWATREGKDKVSRADFEYARDKILMGTAREDVLTGKEKEMTAYHEIGHALLAWILPGADRVHKVTIVPRGRALGVTQIMPEEDRVTFRENDLRAMLVFLLGGRAAEKLVFDQYNAGAEDDLNRATDLARRMVTRWGMSDRLGPVSCRMSEEHPFLGKEIVEQRNFSEHTAQLIDEEVSRILRDADETARNLLQERRADLDRLSQELLKEEILNYDDIERILGPSPNKRPPSEEVAVRLAGGATGLPLPVAEADENPQSAPDESFAAVTGNSNGTAPANGSGSTEAPPEPASDSTRDSSSETQDPAPESRQPTA